MPGIMYTAVFKGVAVTAQQDFFELKASAAGSVVVHGFLLTQENKAGDANEAQFRMTTARGSGSITSGSGGSTPTATPIVRGSPAFGGAVKANNTTKIAAGSGTLTSNLEVHTWNDRVPYQFWYTPEMRPVVMPSEYWALELETTPASSTTMNGTIWFEVVGGA